MTKAERELLLFLAMTLVAELDDWTMMPCRGEQRSALTRLLDNLRDEIEAEKKK